MAPDVMPAPTWADFVGAWELYADPVTCAGLAGLVLGWLGVYIVLRRMVFVSAGITQSAGLGVALSFYCTIHLGVAVNPVVGAVVLALLATTLLLYDPQRLLGITRETLLGLVYAATSAVAVVIGARIAQEAHEISSILFGTAVLVMPEDLRAVAWAAAVIGAVHLIGFRGLTFATLDPAAARVQRLPVGLLSATILLSIGLMVGISARAIGALPVFALSTMPATAALIASRRHLRLTFVLAALGGAFAGVGGYVVAFFHDWPVGATQAGVAAALVPAALLVRGVLRLVPRRAPATAT